MKAALSIVLAGLLILLPIEQVLAQAAQQEAVGEQQTAPSDGVAHLFRVPPLTENAALLLRGSSDGPLLDASLSNTYAVVEVSDRSDDRKILVGIAVVVVIALAIFLVVACGDERCSTFVYG